MTQESWMERERKRLAEAEASKERATQEAIATAANEKVSTMRGEVEPLLPAGVTVDTGIWEHRDDGRRRTPAEQVRVGLRLRLAEGVLVHLWPAESHGMAPAVCTTDGAKLAGVLDLSADGLARALLEAYERAVALQEEQRKQQEREDERRRRQEDYDRQEQQRQALVRQMTEMMAAADEPINMNPRDFVSAPDPLAAFKEALGRLVAEAKAQRVEQQRVNTIRQQLEREAERAVVPQDVTLFKLTFPTAFVQDQEERYAEYRTEYSVSRKPAKEGWWRVVDGDELRDLRVHTVHGSLVVEPVRIVAGTGVANLPEKLRVSEDWEKDGVRLWVTRPSKALGWRP